MISPRTLRALRNIDWDFVVPRSGYVAPLHWYPGTFVPALSDALIEALTQPGAVVFDPYSGAGTTGWSAARLGRSCVLADVNPIAAIAGYVSTSLILASRASPKLATTIIAAISSLVGLEDGLLTVDSLISTEYSKIDSIVSTVATPSPTEMVATIVRGPPNWAAMRCWYEKNTFSELKSTYTSIAKSESKYTKLVCICMLSAIARSLSSQHASWGHIADNVQPKEYKYKSIHVAANRWLKNAARMVQSAQAFTHAQEGQQCVRVDRVDWLSNAPIGDTESDLLLTSPPYADAIDYHLSQRLSLYLLGYNDEEIAMLVSAEIGARRKRFNSTSRDTWSSSIVKAIRVQASQVQDRGSICLILPHRDSGRSAGEDGVRSELETIGWHVVFERDRSIHQAHTRQSWTSIKQEKIIVFSKTNRPDE